MIFKIQLKRRTNLIYRDREWKRRLTEESQSFKKVVRFASCIASTIQTKEQFCLTNSTVYITGGYVVVVIVVVVVRAVVAASLTLRALKAFFTGFTIATDSW